jgi:MarR family transcriptional regulator, organic hydroperoxide resistance regulator
MKQTGEGILKPKPAHPANWREALHDERMAHLIKDAFRCTSSSLQRRLKDHGVLYGHWTFLRILWQTDGLTQRQLSEQAGVTEPSTLLALRSMEAAGYLTRQKLPTNKKEVRVYLTPKGSALRAVCVPCAEQINQLAISGISARDLAATRRTLLAVIENLTQEPSPGPANGNVQGDEDRP